MKPIVPAIFAVVSLFTGCMTAPYQAAGSQSSAPTAPVGQVQATRATTAPIDAPTAPHPGSPAEAPTQPAAATQPTLDSADVTVTVDGAQQFQTIDGFGVNANSASWQSGQLAPALDLLSTKLGANIWRVIVESHENWETINDNDDPALFNWDYYNQLYETPKFQALWGVLQHLDEKQAGTIYLNIMGCVPEWMGRCSIDTGAEDEWVEMVASLLYYARNTKHLRIDIVGPMNEQDLGNPEGPKVGAEQYVRLIHLLSARLDELGLSDIRLLGPDTASVSQAAESYIPAMLGDSAIMAKVQHFASHTYSADTGALDAVLKASAYPDRNFWMTEFSAWCDGCDRGTQPTDDWDFAVQTVEHLFRILNQGAAGALIYDAYDSYYEHHGSLGYWGLLRFDTQTQAYVPRKRFYTSAQVFRFVSPGMRRVEVSFDSTNLILIAFANSQTGGLTIVGRNYSDTALTLGGTLDNLGAVDKLAFYQTTRTADLAHGADVPVVDNAFIAQLAPDSIFTLTSSAPGTLSYIRFLPTARS